MPEYITPVVSDETRGSEIDSEFRAYAAAHAVTAVGCQVRSVPSVQVYLRQACEAVVSGFEKDVSLGNRIYDKFSKETQINTVLGFGPGSEFENLSNDTYNDYLDAIQDPQIAKVYSYVTNAITLGCHLNGNTVSQTKYYLDHSTNYLNQKFEYQVSKLSESAVSGLMERDYSTVSLLIASSTKNKEAEITNYTFYEMSGVLNSPVDLVKMKDSESQYYMISGKIIYDSVVNFNPCEVEYKDINTDSGPKTIKVYKNPPCLDTDKYVGPPNGVGFTRIFHDGPYSSGRMTNPILKEFLNFERERLSPELYRSNDPTLYSFELNNSGAYISLVTNTGKIAVNSYGQYDIGHEYDHSPADYEGDQQTYHIGNNASRARVTGYAGNIPLIGTIPWTGWKYAALELDENVWGKTYSKVLTNPESQVKNTLRRALSFNDSPYVATEDGEYLYTYTLDDQDNQVWSVGPPRIASSNSLPYLAFYQDFDSATLDKKAEVYLRCAIGQSSGPSSGTDGNIESRRSWLISANTIASGKDSSHHEPTSLPGPSAGFLITIPSSGLDEIESKVLAIGNSMDGKEYAIFSGENAGYEFTGYKTIGGDNLTIGPFITPVTITAQGLINKTKQKYTDVNDSLVVNNVIPAANEYYSSGDIITFLESGDVAEFNVINSGQYRGIPQPLVLKLSGSGLSSISISNNPSNLTSYTYTTLSPGVLLLDLKQFFEHESTQETGFYYKDGDTSSSYDQYIVGNPPKETKYVTAINNGSNVYTTRQYAQDSTGKLYEYHYFDNRITNLGLEQKGWEHPFPYPSGLDNQGYTKVFATQRTENYHPRYSKGPYAKVEKPFLYPNAKLWYSGNGATLGFPKSLNVKVVIKEEAIKEIYEHYEITYLGLYTNPPFLKEMDRSSSPSPFGFAGPANEQIFKVSKNADTWDIENEIAHPSDGGFYYFQPLNLVDNYWVTPDPTYNYNVFQEIRQGYPIGRNRDVYNTEPTFNHGILLTGYRGNQAYKIYNGTGSYTISGFIGRHAHGLYHKYTGYSFELDAQYVRPGYSVSTRSFHPEYSTGVFFYMRDETEEDEGAFYTANGAKVFLTNGTTIARAGQDLIWFENVGGRKYEQPEKDGGYHSKGLIGDSWMAFTGRAYGINREDLDCESLHERTPSSDNKVIILNVTETGTSLHTRALEYNPFVFSKRSARDFIVGDTVINNANLSFNHSGSGIIFDIGSALPLKTATEGEYYDASGLILGPFDRDVYLQAITDVTGFNEIHVDREWTRDLYSNCEAYQEPPPEDGEDSPEEEVRCCMKTIYASGEIIKYIPSGQTININLRFYTGDYGGTNIPPISGVGLTKIGFPSNSYVGIYPVRFDGEVSLSSQFNYDINGEEMLLNMPHNGVNDLEGKTFTFVTASRTGVLYPIPPEEDFNKYATVDGANNKSFFTVEDYWRQHHRTGGASATAYGWREGSRISIHFEKVAPKSYNDFPYDIDSYIVPSGNCVISGKMDYYSQAESAVFTEGALLVDSTPEDLLIEAGLHINMMSPIMDRMTGFGNLTLPASGALKSGPTRQISRLDPYYIKEDGKFKKENTYSPTYYNRFLVPAISDLKFLNGDDSIESLPPNDPETYPLGHLLISAARGQELSDGTLNLNTKKQYYVQQINQFYDSVSTDSIANYDHFVTSNRGTIVTLMEPESGYLVPKGTTPHDIKIGMT